ncbi:MAG: lipid IV(A) 3-deoxy-D-manno-octulosonic acid transferase [Xanthomonadales bacterium]|nr:lipid IV(A) 3-deoxy-D-manno-octulosonic acid transferase [Xanthomonadales bacterium]
MRRLYSLLLYLVTPMALAYLFVRGLRSRGYRERWTERFGWFDAPQKTPGTAGAILVHAASLGEVNAAAALLRELRLRLPGRQLQITTVTPAGSARVRELFGDEAFHVYAPLDLPGAVKRFYDCLGPDLLVIMETEIWPNLFGEAARRGIPIVIANARISPRSLGRYRRLRRFTAQTLEHVSVIGAQSEADAARLREIGALPGRLTVTGNLKFDVRLDPGVPGNGAALRRAWGAGRPTILGGSTHEGDERPLLQAFRGLLPDFPDALLLLAPRRPERFLRAAQLVRDAGLQVALRSAGLEAPADTQCLLIDSMGELPTFYAACDVAFVGGSLEPHGGHNVLEAAALARPVLVGPHTFNFADITGGLVEAGAAWRVADAAELEAALRRLLADAGLRERMGAAGRRQVRTGQGALERTLALIQERLTPAAG